MVLFSTYQEFAPDWAHAVQRLIRTSAIGSLYSVQTETQQQYDDTGKVVFDDYYNQPDPRMYFTSLGELNYRIAGEAQPVFLQTLKALRETRKITDVKAVDLGCSYGINAALMKYDVDLDDLNAHYKDANLDDLNRDEVLERDVRFFGEHDMDTRIESIGIDTSANAINYALDAGLLDEGIIKNLEEQPFDSKEAELLEDVDLVMSTGCIGYVTEASVGKILKATGDDRPWMAHAVIRMFPFEPYRELLSERGYVTEQLDGTLLQRQFASVAEKKHVLENLEELGIDPEGYESEGWYHANFFVSRPVEEARTPLSISI